MQDVTIAAADILRSARAKEISQLHASLAATMPEADDPDQRDKRLAIYEKKLMQMASATHAEIGPISRELRNVIESAMLCGKSNKYWRD